MKLATYHDGSRDGQLLVVSRDLALAHYASGIATRMQQVLDDWNFMSPQLEELSQTLNHGRARHAFAFEPAKCMAPLPRAFRRAVAEAYSDTAEPTLVEAAGDGLLGPREDISIAGDAAEMDFEAGLAVLTGDVAAAASADESLEGVRLLMLVCDLRVRPVGDPSNRAASRFASAFGPVAVTPEELGAAWSGGRVHQKLDIALNGQRFGLVDAGAGMRHHFGTLIASLAARRGVGAGSIVGSGAAHDADPSRGFASIAAKRALEDAGAPGSRFMRAGDNLRIDMRGADNHNVFGTIEQRVVAA